MLNTRICHCRSGPISCGRFSAQNHVRPSSSRASSSKSEEQPPRSRRVAAPSSQKAFIRGNRRAHGHRRRRLSRFVPSSLQGACAPGCGADLKDNLILPETIRSWGSPFPLGPCPSRGVIPGLPGGNHPIARLSGGSALTAGCWAGCSVLRAYGGPGLVCRLAGTSLAPLLGNVAGLASLPIHGPHTCPAQ